eukprot:TRINITY_DN385_c0_g1_i2.p1 TRINITY_DN385_c0_g1~~TRINITY_DN385_c0_g1_i2.p1  ORF type:complete len:332 (+),score=127.35 TRINITY_DN385_c0_g1_i2:41-1036(+)
MAEVAIRMGLSPPDACDATGDAPAPEPTRAVTLRGLTGQSKRVSVAHGATLRRAATLAFGEAAAEEGVYAMCLPTLALDPNDTQAMLPLLRGKRQVVLRSELDEAGVLQRLSLVHEDRWERRELDSEVAADIDGSTVRLMHRGQQMKVVVKTLTGKTLEVELLPQHRVEELKNMIREMDGVPEDQQRLIYAGKQLEDERTLGDYSITDASEIHLVLRLRGGMFQETSGREQLELLARLQAQQRAACVVVRVGGSDLRVPVTSTVTVGDVFERVNTHLMAQTLMTWEGLWYEQKVDDEEDEEEEEEQEGEEEEEDEDEEDGGSLLMALFGLG